MNSPLIKWVKMDICVISIKWRYWDFLYLLSHGNMRLPLHYVVDFTSIPTVVIGNKSLSVNSDHLGWGTAHQ